MYRFVQRFALQNENMILYFNNQEYFCVFRGIKSTCMSLKIHYFYTLQKSNSSVLKPWNKPSNVKNTTEFWMDPFFNLCWNVCKASSDTCQIWISHIVTVWLTTTLWTVLLVCDPMRRWAINYQHCNCMWVNILIFFLLILPKNHMK